MKIKKIAPLLGGVVLAASMGTSAAAEVWDMVNEYNDSSLHAATQLLFGEILEEQTNGDIKINHHFGGAMGYSSQDQFDAVGDGALQLAITNITTLGGFDPLFLFPSLPFLFHVDYELRQFW